ncbi:hypothetical protein COCMIDRAFT_6043 [Bipolaris oryzae ATCC 44560]|uniref:Uncharacterized protein n=1 Tax=Bipolaris oryzae ATCC 44560 TaxID=930090 RepID=W6Z471_COCMI|nr:uncharacterized protein COCMIDRAFT_6043 [Bipolaris oryzae ATCC 44560]EUC44710.1 hypothetical protein COCMIDRAFT_6043 [Bipolaris oryzae ATCC 44560]
MPRKRSYFNGPGRVLGTGELIEPKRNVRKAHDMEYIPPKDAEFTMEDGNHENDVQDRTEDEEWTPESKKRKRKRIKTQRDEASTSTKKGVSDKNEQCLLKESNDNDAAVAEGLNGGGRHECSCAACKKLRGEEDKELSE